ncbi:MAG: hypothetical protein ACO2PN_17320 [Pyrobaculum sp.]
MGFVIEGEVCISEWYKPRSSTSWIATTLSRRRVGETRRQDRLCGLQGWRTAAETEAYLAVWHAAFPQTTQYPALCHLYQEELKVVIYIKG